MNNEYNHFASRQQRNSYVCKSEINNKLLEELDFKGVVYVDEVVEIFENIRDTEKYIIVKTGPAYNLKKQRHTKYVKKSVLRDEIYNYLISQI